MQGIDLIGAAFGWGAALHEAEWGPAFLKEQGYFSAFEQANPLLHTTVLEAKTPYHLGNRLSYAKRVEEVAYFSKKLAALTGHACQSKRFPLVIGGDHSIAIGTWSGVVSALEAWESFGLIWVDAHMDAHTPITTPSQAIHGMPLAVLMGAGESTLVELTSKRRNLNPAHIVLIGVRSYEAGEAQLLKDKQVKVIFMETVEKYGFQKVFEEALTYVTKDTKGFGVSIDLDAFDPRYAPGVGSPAKQGIDPETAYAAFARLKDFPQCKALEIAEYNPTRDIQNKTANVIANLVDALHIR